MKSNAKVSPRRGGVLLAVLSLLVLGWTWAAGAPAEAAGEEGKRVAAAPAGAAGGKPLRVLMPQFNGADEPWRLCIGLCLQERLAENPEIILAQGERAYRWARWLASGVFADSPAQRWQRLTQFVELDAWVEITSQEGVGRNPPSKLTLLVRNAAGETRLDFPVDDKTSMAALAGEMGLALGQALQLPQPQRQALGRVDIADPQIFNFYYRSQQVWAPYPQNPFGNILADAAAVKEDHWALQVAQLRVALGYLAPGRREVERSLTITAGGLIPRCLVRLLGSEHEAAITAVVEERQSWEQLTTQAESVLWEMVQPLRFGARLEGQGKGSERIQEIEEIGELENLDQPSSLQALEAPTLVGSKTGQASFTAAQQQGALRLLGAMRSQKALPFFKEVVGSKDVAVRSAAALALGHYSEEAGIDLLTQLAKDKDQTVAWAAQYGLWKRGKAQPEALVQARRMIAQTGPAHSWGAAMLLAAKQAADLPALEKLQSDADPALRQEARRVLASLPSSDPRQLLRRLSDGDSKTVLAALAQVPADAAGPLADKLMQLCDDLDSKVAWAARDFLAPRRPAEAQARAQFDLATAAVYFRAKILEELAASSEPWAAPLLAAACENAQPQTRIKALQLLAKAGGKEARALLIKALGDHHRVVRLQACALIAAAAEPGDEVLLEQALAQEKDAAGKLYLGEALARARKQTPPAAPPAARSVNGPTNLTWFWGGADGNSAYQAYYQGTLRVNDTWKKAYAAGKIHFARIDPISTPGMLAVDPMAVDDMCRAVDGILIAEELPFLDGVVYGEESMAMSPLTPWAEGWRLFCQEANLDPGKIQGVQENLSPRQQLAWRDWALRRHVEGFNALYDYTKLRAGKLRPGLQVCTFLPAETLHQVGPNPGAATWKFDVGGVYHYMDDTRKTAYSLVRHYRTLWPDRPVIWLSSGIGVYERTPVQYRYQTPNRPMTHRGQRAYADSLTAYLAGAHTGWFSVWPFLKHDWVNKGMTSLKGPTADGEQIYRDSPELKRGIEWAFNGVEDLYRNKSDIDKAAQSDIGLDQPEPDPQFDQLLAGTEGQADPIAARVALEKQRMYEGFLYYHLYLNNLAHLFASLPRRQDRPDSLVIEREVNLWYGQVGSPGADLLTSYDYLLDINLAPTLDLKRYRLIVVRDPGALTDQTIAALTAWLRDSAGLLYVHQDLSTNRADKVASIADIDGPLKEAWPWEKDVQTDPLVAKPGKPAKPAPLQLQGSAGALPLAEALVLRTFQSRGGAAQVLYQAADKPVLVLWRDPGLRGAVLFDGIGSGGKDYRNALRQQINLLAAQGIGRKLDGPIRQQLDENPQWHAAVTAGSPQPVTTPGVDLITGVIDPVVGGKSAAFIAREFTGKFVAAHAGVAALGDKPLEGVTQREDGLQLSCAGLIQVVTAQPQRLKVHPAEGPPLPVIAPENLSKWLLLGGDEGIATFTNEGRDEKAIVTYVRCPRPLRITLAAAEK